MSPTPFASAVDVDACTHWHRRACYTAVQTTGDDGRQLLRLWTLWQQQQDAGAPVPQRLHYFMLVPQQTMPERLLPASSERDPLGLLPQLQALWPPATPGYHRLLLAQGQLILTLIVGDIAPALMQLDGSVDCFLLHDDQTLWTPALLARLARLAAPLARLCLPQAEARYATHLQQAGFVVTASNAAEFAPRWQIAATPVGATADATARHAIVIGAGLAGSAACERLAARGWQVTLLERHGQPAQEASGNLAGVYMPSISRDDNPTAKLSRAAFLFAQQVWAQVGVFAAGQTIGAACGVLHLARDATQAWAFEEAARHWRYPPEFAQWLSPQAASARLGMAAGSGWWFPRAGWLRPALLCEAMLAACATRLQRHFHHTALTLRRCGQDWQVLGAEGAVLAQAPALILANGMDALHFEQAATLPLQSIRGQVSHVPAAQLPALPLALCGDGYLTGAVDGVISMGASYDQGDEDVGLRLDSHMGNLTKLQQMLPQWHAEVDPATWSGRVGFRCVSADRLPLAGALPDMTALAAGGEVQLREVPRHPQLYGLLGYASRGLIWAPLAAEIVACHLTGEPMPLGKDALALLDPGRFALKAHRRTT